MQQNYTNIPGRF